MADREDVVKRLRHYQGLTTLQSLSFPKERVEFHSTIEDVLTLLKAQDPRVLPWEEVDKSGNSYVWAEIRSFYTDEKALIYCTIVNSEFFENLYRLREDSGIEWVRVEEDYNRDDSQGSHSGWRCWTARPTEEQRKAVPWNE